MERSERQDRREAVGAERRRRVALLRALCAKGGLAGLAAYCEQVLADAAFTGR
jgi:hypothetical protein